MTTRTNEIKAAGTRVTFLAEVEAIASHIKASSCEPYLGGYRLGWPESRSKFLTLVDTGDGCTIARTTDTDDFLRQGTLRTWRWVRGEDAIEGVAGGLRLAILQRVPLTFPFTWADSATLTHFTEAANLRRELLAG